MSPVGPTFAICLLTIAFLAGCTPDQVAQPRATVADVPSQRAAAPTEAETRGWETIAPAMEYRRVRLRAGVTSGLMTAVRLDPKRYHIRVAYDRDHPGTIREWGQAIKPLVMVNGGYFDEKNRATALVIFDGIARGTSYEGFGGMVVVDRQGKFELRSLRQQPYDANEPIQQAMQSTPMLIQPGGVMSDIQSDEARARRTVIARDRAGRILLMVSDFADFTLPELARAVKDSDLDLDAALNLDGGRSTGMYIGAPGKHEVINDFVPLPLVLVVDQD